MAKPGLDLVRVDLRNLIVCAPKMAFISLPIDLNRCFGCSKEPSHCDGSFEYPQHLFWVRNTKIIFQYALLSGCLIIQPYLLDIVDISSIKQYTIDAFV